MREIRVGLIGFGTLGREVAEAIHNGRAGRAKLVSVLVRSPEKVEPECAARLGCRFTADAAEFLDSAMDLVVEVAGHAALHAYAEAVLRADKDLMVASAGAFAADGLWKRVSRLAHDRGRQVYIPSGGIGGLDLIGSAALAELDEVTLVILKPPDWLLPPDEARGVQDSGEPRELFSGAAREVVLRYPAIMNVAAALSLAGIGLDRTAVRVVADPAVTCNAYEISAKGHFGEVRILLQNIPGSHGKKTGRVVPLAFIKAIRNLTTPVVGI